MQSDIIKELIDSFSPGVLIRFLEEKDEEFEFLREKYEPEGDFREIELIARKELEDSNKFGVWVIKTQAELSERSGKRKQFELAKNILKNDFFDAGLFAFYDENGNFRLSLVYAIYKGKKLELSSYKRYTHFIEKGKRYRT
ncbi:MAG: class I SAM-dependent DNA methyltransferase, partial [candidate division WOR-3 bacterium]